MRIDPLRLHANTAETFEQNGEATAFRSWLARHRPDLTPNAQQALVRHLARAISAFGAAEINAALFDLQTFEQRLRLTVAVEPRVPTYASRHWRRAVRNFVAAAYGMTGREATSVLSRPRRTLKQAHRANFQPLPLQQNERTACGNNPAPRPETPDRGDNAHETGAQPTVAQLVDATRTTWATLAQVGDVQPQLPGELIAAQLSCLSTAAKLQLLDKAELLEEPVRVDDTDSVRLVDLVDEKLGKLLRDRLARTTHETPSR